MESCRLLGCPNLARQAPWLDQESLPDRAPERLREEPRRRGGPKQGKMFLGTPLVVLRSPKAKVFWPPWLLFGPYWAPHQASLSEACLGSELRHAKHGGRGAEQAADPEPSSIIFLRGAEGSFLSGLTKPYKF